MRIKLPYGTTQENNLLTLQAGELAVDVERKAIRFHDGVTQGGFEVLGEQVVYSPFVKWMALDQPFPGTVRAIAYGQGRYIAVGNESNTMYTTLGDGIWTKIDIPNDPAVAFSDLLYANGLWVAVGYNGVILTSVDGLTWTMRVGPGLATTNLNQVHYANGRWVVVGVSRGLVTSTDGIVWNRQTIPLPINSSSFYSVHYGNGQWLACGTNGVIISSIDGLAWTQKQWIGSGGPNYSTIHWCGDRWIRGATVGTVEQSFDGSQWTVCNLTPPLSAGVQVVKWVSDYCLVAGSKGFFATTQDFNNWAIIPVLEEDDLFYDISTDGQNLLMAGRTEHVYKVALP